MISTDFVDDFDYELEKDNYKEDSEINTEDYNDDDIKDDIEAITNDPRENAYENYVTSTDNEALKAMTNTVELYLKKDCQNKKFYTDQELAQIYQSLHSGDPMKAAKAREQISMGMYKYVRHIASKKFGAYYKYLNDIIQEGCMAVLLNIDKYNPQKGKMTTFFKMPIIHQIQEYISKNELKVEKANHYGNNLKKIDKIINEKLKNGQPIVIDDICISGGINKTTLERSLKLKYNNDQSASLDDENSYIGNIAESNVLDPEKVMITKEKNEELARILNTLDEDSRHAMVLRIGLLDGEEHSVADIAKMMDLSPQTVKHLVNKAYIKVEAELQRSRNFNTDRLERAKKYNIKAINLHSKSQELQKVLDAIDLEQIDLGDIDYIA